MLEAMRFEREYSHVQEAIKNHRFKSRLAVVIHLFYTENWTLFRSKLNNLAGIDFELIVTVPESNLSFCQKITAEYPNAIIVAVPNRGRDVLPFIKVASVLEQHGIGYVLKFHSKKSTHWEGGQDWLEGMMERLLPSKRSSLDLILKALEDKNTGIIGPSDVYYPLTINFPANGAHMTKVIGRLYDKRAAHDILQVRRGEFGFFGGTMFWARLDSIKPLLSYGVHRFEAEAGQVDGTFAHALERLFCLVPEIDTREMYELNADGILSHRNYQSKNIPEWSTDHDK